MKPYIFVFLMLMTALLLCSCSVHRYAPNGTLSYTEITTEQKTEAIDPETTQPDPEPQKKELVMAVNGIELDVAWEDNETVAELLAYAKSKHIIVNTTIYGGFEQVGSLPQSFVRNDVQMTTGPGDIVLYSGNQLVVFFGSNSWSYTKLGHINLAGERLTELLGGDSAVIEIKYE